MYTITPKGPFELRETAAFAYVDRESTTTADGRVVLAFCDDATFEPTTVTVAQHGRRVQVDGPAGTRGQVERILGLDVDAAGFREVGERDEVIGRLQDAAPGLRPPQIPSAYEAAVFCILTARRSAAQARHTRRALADAAGTTTTVDGETVVCLPPPAVLLDPPRVRGLDDVRRARLTGIARAALDGRLHTPTLARRDPEDARRELETLAGIGPFSSAIVVVRSLGHTDYLAGPVTELNRLVGELYGLGHDATDEELTGIAEAWRPWRTWSQLHVRSVSPRLAVSTGSRP